MAYLKFLITAVTATWSVLSFVYAVPFAPDPSHKQTLGKQVSCYTVSSCAVFEETPENDCKKSDNENNACSTFYLVPPANITSMAAPVTHQHLQNTPRLYLLHCRLLI